MRELLKKKNDEYRLLVEEELSRIVDGCASPEPLASAMRYSLLAGGKRLRPCLALLVLDAVLGEADGEKAAAARKAALRLGCAIELIHTYSLIHDDLPCMDDDSMRRGKPSNHIVFGEGQAVLAGDGLLTLAFERILAGALEFSGEGYVKAAHEIAARALGMVNGQSRDLEAERGASVDEAELLYIHRHKTADLITAGILAGAYSAGADAGTISVLTAFGEKLGLLFQITDDILDHAGDAALVGKTLGKDAVSEKLTYVRLHGADGARRLAAQTAHEATMLVDGAKLKNGALLIETVKTVLERDR